MAWLRVVAGLAAVAAFAETPPPVSPEALRVEVSYLASDYLKGRNTPSPELDIAADFIASQFQRAGLEPAGKDGFFQTAQIDEVTTNEEGFHLSLNGTGVPLARAAILNAAAAAATDAPVRKVSKGEIARLKDMAPAESVVLVVEAAPTGFREIIKEAARLKPVALILLTPRESRFGRGGQSLRVAGMPIPACPVLTVSDPEGKLFTSLPEQATASLRMAAPRVRTSTARNVIGLLRGSDPELRDTYVVVSAHYDHLGMRTNLEGDGIFNGANDDASGTASVIEVAASLAAAKPKRSILFMAFFGEEKGLLGAGYYVRNPLVPLARTVANLNLEQMGRTDDNDGARVARANLTGFDYSNIGSLFAEAGKPLGVEFYKEEAKSDAYFRSSDNYSFAEAGIPAHTISVAYMYPDYRPGDEWPKLDYENMAKVDRAVAAGVLALANRAQAPAWNADNPRAAPFAKAR